MMRIPNEGIVFRSILITLAAFIVASVGSISYTAYATGERANLIINTRLNQLLDTVQSTIKTACFITDQDLAKEVALGLLSNSEVLQVTIKAGETMLADEVRNGAKRQTQATEPGTAVLERQIVSPFAADQIIGEVRLTPNPEVIENLRSDDIILAAKQLLWQLSLVSIVIISALIVFFVRPISRMSLALHKMDPTAGERLSIPTSHTNTEIGLLVRSVNQLADHLVAAIDAAREARGVAEAASTAKSAFLANMSHEIRTPLSAVLGLARIGARDSAESTSRETFGRILDAGDHLLAVIDDILDFSKIEAGKLTIDPQPVRSAALIDAAINLVAGRAAAKGLALTSQAADDLFPWVLGDAMRIRQILVNLLANAVKFTEHGRVILTVQREAGNTRFAISDEGIGMTADEISRLFRPFEQADNSTTRRFGGTGLGLAISINLARLMGGDIQVSSSPGQGSTFTLTLPLPATEAPAALPDDLAATSPGTRPMPAGKRLAGLRVLAAEDVEVNRLILDDLLEQEGAVCTFAFNGREALEHVEADSTAFDVVLMDVQMPEMDGHEATRRIHAFTPQLPVIGLTAHALAEERNRCLASGMVAHITKPIDAESLVATILQWTLPVTESAAQLETPAAIPASGHFIPPAPTFHERAGEITGEVDWPALLACHHGKTAFILRIAKTVVDSHAETPQQLRQLAEAGDFAALAFLAHKIKGVAGNLSATSAQALASATEAAARLLAELTERIAAGTQAPA